MPRNGSSVYSLPAGNPVVPGTTITTAWANGTLTDIATALTQSLSTDGSTATVSLAGKTITNASFTSPTATGGTLTSVTLSGPTVQGITNLTGGRIQFPASQVVSSNANTLDDYEEGTFTPSIAAATPGNLAVTYTVRLGTYVKIGAAVTFAIRCLTSSFTWSTSSGNLRLSGLPFATSSTSQYWPVANGYATGITTGVTDFSMGAYVPGSAAWVEFNFYRSSTGMGSTATIANTTSGVNLEMTAGGTYYVAF